MNERPNPSNTESLRDKLTREQVEHMARERSQHHAQALRDTTRDYDEQADFTGVHAAITYRLYTEYRPGIAQLVARYLDGATIYDGIGLWRDNPGAFTRGILVTEFASIIEIVGTRADLQRVCDLAGDIKVANRQSSVLVTWAPCARLDV